MSQRVELALVRFSDIERAYYFYDPRHPEAIQFAINGNWESWHVGWVRHHTHDPTVKRIAEEAEAHLIRSSSTYQQWHPTSVPQLAPVRLPPPADVDARRSTTNKQPPHQHEVESPPSVNLSPIRHSTIDSSMSPPSLPALLFSPALHSASTPHSHSSPEETPPSSAQERSLKLPPMLSPAPASQHALPRSAAAATSSLVPAPSHFLETVTSPTATTTLNLPVLKSGMDRKRKAITLQQSDEEDENMVRKRTGEQDVEYQFGPPRTRRKSGPGTHHTDSIINQALSPLEASQNSALRSPADEAHAGINRNLPLGRKFSDSPNLPAIRSPQATRGPSRDDKTPDPSVQPPLSAVLQLHHNRDVKIILSLDGDGIRGLSQVFLVEALVGAICTKLNANVEPFQVFDLIGGASMGGLLAVLLSRLRLPAHAAREAFKYIAREVFTDKNTFFSSFDLRSQPLVHDGKALEDAIKTVVAAELPHQDECLSDSRADSANVFVVSTQVDIDSNKPALLRSYQSRRKVGPEVDDDMPVWRAIKSAVIAPRYMQPRNGTNWRPVIEPGLVDHGTAKNNPVRDALFECRKLFNYTNDMVVIVSIGTGRGLNLDRESPEMAKNIRTRKAEAETLSQRFGSENAHLMERGWMKYFRFDVPGLQDVPLEEWCHEDRIREKTTTYLAEPEVGTAFHQCVGEIAAIMMAMPRQL